MRKVDIETGTIEEEHFTDDLGLLAVPVEIDWAVTIVGAASPRNTASSSQLSLLLSRTHTIKKLIENTHTRGYTKEEDLLMLCREALFLGAHKRYIFLSSPLGFSLIN